MKIRKIEPRDFATVAQLENENWTQEGTPHVMNSSVEGVLKKVLNGTTYLLAVNETDQIMALLDYAPKHNIPAGRHVVTFGLVTVKAYRRQGLAKRLLQAFLERAKAEGFQKVAIQVLGSNQPALQLYEAFGFVKEAELKSEFFINGKFVNDLTLAYYLDSSIL